MISTYDKAAATRTKEEQEAIDDFIRKNRFRILAVRKANKVKPARTVRNRFAPDWVK